MITLHNISMRYPLPKRYVDYLKRPFAVRWVTALHNICINIDPGDRIAFMGTNGAGKTTLLKLIGGLLYPYTGFIKVNGFDTVKENLKARSNVGYVLNEERSFYWRLSGKENLSFFGALDNMHGAVRDKKIMTLLNIVGLSPFGDKLFAGYSSGMKQRLAIARGLLTDPPILILDEPTRTLDPAATKDIKDILLKHVHVDRIRTLLIATHNLAEAETLCTKVCFMNEGRLLRFAPIDQLLAEFGTLENCYNTLFDRSARKINAV